MSPSASLTMGRFVSNMGQFIKFGLVGGSGTVVNLAVTVAAKKISGWAWGIHEKDVFLPLFDTGFNIRWYNIFTVVAFLVANTWNYQLNRMWTFKSVSRVSWLRGFWPFLMTGLGALFFSQIVLVALMNPHSPFGLPEHIFDDSTGLRTKFYWATAISIVASMPVNFIFNKLWTFRDKPREPVMVEDTQPV